MLPAPVTAERLVEGGAGRGGFSARGVSGGRLRPPPPSYPALPHPRSPSVAPPSPQAPSPHLPDLVRPRLPPSRPDFSRLSCTRTRTGKRARARVQTHATIYARPRPRRSRRSKARRQGTLVRQLCGDLLRLFSRDRDLVQGRVILWSTVTKAFSPVPFRVPPAG